MDFHSIICQVGKLCFETSSLFDADALHVLKNSNIETFSLWSNVVWSLGNDKILPGYFLYDTFF